MKDIARSISINLVPIVCVIAALVIACTGKDGWGWFLFIAFMCVSTFKGTN